MFNIGVVLLLFISTFPIIDSLSIKVNAENKITNKFSFIEKIKKPDIVEINIYIYPKNDVVKKIVKELPTYIMDELMDRLIQVELLDVSFRELLDEKFEILKEYGLVSSYITLEDIFDVDKLEPCGKQTDIVSGEDFSANSSIIFFTGIGLGVGLGPGLRLFNGFQYFLLAMAGLGLVLCYDINKDTLYTLQTFLFPILVGYLSDYVGIIMFAIFPGIFYSNFFSLGYTSSTYWFQIFI